QNTRALKRAGEALLSDSTLKPFKFFYYEGSEPEEGTAFRYIYDGETNSHIPHQNVYAIAFPIGLRSDEKKTFCKGLAKMSIGALAYLLKNQGVDESVIRKIFLQTSIDVIRHFALDQPWHGKTVAMKFSLGRSDVLMQLHSSCSNQQVRNHVLKIVFQEDNSIHIEGMLYSQYGWVIDLSNQFPTENRELRLENSITHMNAPRSLEDLSLSPDTICIINPDYRGQIPNIPNHWKNINNDIA
ncbi:MAG: hypothetical protein KAR20_30055, partial [Candidatus Heimdallarchaeota archaeon]|nr:hypothetical protein [Candidatus Heimdallarchaeota archaeon]